MIYNFLKINGFKMLAKDASIFFGDHYELFTNGNIQLRFSSSKFFETIDIRSDLINENWYDLTLISALLHDEKDLNNVIPIDEQEKFLQEELVNIGELFSNGNYSVTKEKLKKLVDERVRQMFPGLKR